MPASAGIAKLALQQIEDELRSETDAHDLAEILRGLRHEDDHQDGVFASLAQLLTVAAHAVEQMELDRDGEVSCPLYEAAALITGSAGLQTTYATRALDPQGEEAE